MSAVGTVSSADRASFGDNNRDCWRVWFNLDNPHALPDTGSERPFGFGHSWAFDVSRHDDTPPCENGDRVTVSTHGRTNVLLTRKNGKSVLLHSLAGIYDPTTRC
jgi:hypothetical protein